MCLPVQWSARTGGGLLWFGVILGLILVLCVVLSLLVFVFVAVLGSEV